MKIFNVLALVLVMFASTSVFGAHLSEELLITARLTGGQEVPAVTTNATGVAGFKLNAAKDSLCVDIIAIGLSGTITGIHIHDGAMGTNGGVLINLSTFVTGNRIQTVITGADLTQELLGKLLSGMTYLNVHTAANPNGEIRGQLKLETDRGFKAELDAAQEVHVSTSAAIGLAAVTVSLTSQKLEVKLVTTGLTGAITGAHLHFGAMGVAGGVAVNLSTLINGNTITGTVDITGMTSFMDSLAANKIYVNIHTAANPNGEIRGQLMMNHNLIFDGVMDTSQEPHAVLSSTANGVVIVEVNPTLDTVFTYSLVDGLSGMATAAHLHEGGVGVSGGVVLNVSTGIMGSQIMAMNSLDISTAADLDILNALLKGDIYLNIHTVLNPSGEVRGQLSRLAREGYTVDLNGEQEVPSVSVPGQGVGIVSIDRGRTNAHFMVVVQGLSGNLTGAHFHNAAAGVNGGVVYNLTSSFSTSATESGAFGYWTDTDAAAMFMAANEVMFRNEEIYINIHTAANAGGEIRGQVMREGSCETATSTIAQSIFEDVRIFPNPATDRLTLSMTLTEAFDGNLIITNTVGQVMRQENLAKGTDLSNYAVNVQDLPTGMYFLTVQNETQKHTIRFVKQ
jgi:hypothetical protein